MSFPIPADERERLRRLPAYDLLGSPSEPEYDDIAKLCAELFDVPVCLLTFMGEHEQWTKAQFGADLRSLPRETSFCTHTIADDAPTVVADASTDARFRDNPLVRAEAGVRFYAGAPVTAADGVRLGALCVIDTRARSDFTPEKARLLTRMAGIVSTRVEARRAARMTDAVGSFADATRIALITADAGGRVTSWNPAAAALFGHRREDMLGNALDVIVPDRFRAAHNAGMARCAAGGGPAVSRTVEVIALHRDGAEFPIELTLCSWVAEDGVAVGAQAQDIAARRARQADLEHLARHDELTGLINRGGFREAVEARLARGGDAAVLAIDMDGFKGVNDTLGHAVGDALLQTAALRMTACVGDALLGRLGGDEFAVLMPAGSDLHAASATARCLLDGFAEVFAVAGHQLHVGASIGIALGPEQADDVDDLLVRADLALFRAKGDGGRCCRLFDGTMRSQLAARRAFADELRDALPGGQWELHYQPQVGLPDGALIGAEALLRWRHPRWGLLMPATFMPVLETHLVAFEVGCWVMREACAQLARWRRAGLDVPRIGVNLFSAQVHARSLGTVVADALAHAGLRPGDLELEITENIAIVHEDDALAPLHALLAQGVGVAFDDFGTGFASLSTLQRFPLSRIKIDRRFVRDIRAEPHSMAIVRGIVAMGDQLGLEVIAEGVETPEQQGKLETLGCRQAQGFLYGAGMEGDAFLAAFAAPARAARGA